MEHPEETPYAQKAPTRDLAELRLRAEDFARREDDEGLVSLAEDLRTDREMWTHLWAPALAVATVRSGRTGGIELLEEAAAGGFSQPELFEGRIEQHFASLPQWEQVKARMDANVPAPPLELVQWPDPAPALPLLLDRLPAEREEVLRDQLPSRASSAWETAIMLLGWVRGRWEHANDHVEDPDALEVLARVAAGERFACVEYSIVLSQALNAVQIPARRVHLFQANYHTGVGRSHVVSEAWIDDLRCWVVLDGQNGAYWADTTGTPLGVLELQGAFARGEQPATMVSVLPQSEPPSAVSWWTYFANAKTTGYAWGGGQRPFSAVFQTTAINRTPRLLHDPRAAYVDLGDVAVGVCGDIDHPRLALATMHPYAVGFVVSEEERAYEVTTDATWQLRDAPGTHVARIAVRTPYGTGQPAPVRYRLNS